MSGIVLSASVRQNLLALQSTASLLAKTQNNLATGNKVNTALDNPTEFFTAQALNNRAATRANLVSQYNNVLAQINTTAQDASFNGVNLLNGDTLKLVFNETGRSTLNITGVTFNDAGLGLSSLTAGTDFLDNNSANKALSALNAAATTLRSEASALGSNLSIV